MDTDIFNNTIICGKCESKMFPVNFSKDGFLLRAVKCEKCGNRIIHPRDEQEYKDFVNLKKKQFNVKMRFVGNSYAVSIPKEIVNFMREQEKVMDDMVRLCFEEFGRISLRFNNPVDKENLEKLKNE
jgi:DNA-directed RNA polymerase subunit RPC12/RpoP